MRVSSRPASHAQPFRRVAVTVPPHDWFHGIARELFQIYRQALIDLGCSVFDVPVDLFLPPDVGRITALLAELRAFRPELAIGLPTGSYALICRLPPERHGWRPNLFIDVLELPTICMWEHAPIELADQLLRPLPDRPADSRPGAIDALRRVLANPLLLHWSRDSGQTPTMQQLGLIRPDRVVQIGTAVPPEFVSAATAGEANTAGDAGVAFIGHFYQHPPTFAESELELLKQHAIEKWMAEKSRSLWDAVVEQVAALPADLRQRLALEQDQTFFWRFAHRLIAHEAQTIKRLHVLGGAGVPIAVCGNLQPDAPGVPANLRVRPDRFRFGPELAAAFAHHPIAIDVLNSGYVDGYSFKAMIGFASGGFVLVDRKQDFIDAFGELGEAITYRDAGELAGKVDRFLGDPRGRRELGDAMRAEIRAKHMLDQVLARVLRGAAQVFDVRALGSGPSVASPRERLCSTVQEDLLSGLQTHSHWLGARVESGPEGARITTPAKPWAYAAEIPIAARLSHLREPHLRLSLTVEAGRIGICLIRSETGELLSEQLASAMPHAIEMNVELPQDTAVALVLRNTVKGTSRACVKEVLLCERK
jgi:hypothetical protein